MINRIARNVLVAFATTLALIALLNGQQPAPQASAAEDKSQMPCPMMQDANMANGSEAEAQKSKHMAAMIMRGEHAMGFSQTKTTHHFRLMRDGGAIEVGANDPSDTASREQIRQHLAHISRAFSSGDFSTPIAVHQRVPSGTTTMKRLGKEISYKFEETETGGRVRILTSNKLGLAAVYAFLRFQIKEHQTGDALELKD